MVDVQREVSLEPRDAGAGQVAALDHDQRVELRPSPSRQSRCARCPGSPANAVGGTSWLTMRTDLPIARSAAASASCDPIESPSGRACEVSRNVRDRLRRASPICRRMSESRMRRAGSMAGLARLRGLVVRRSLLNESPRGALRRALHGRSTRRTGTPAPARGAAAGAARSYGEGTASRARGPRRSWSARPSSPSDV